MTSSPRLSLPYLSAAQSQKHVTVNDSLRKLDALVQLSVVSRTVAAQPGAPADGDVYILPAGKTGAAWATMTDLSLGYYVDGAWSQLTPKEGWRAFVQDTNEFLFFDGAAWTGVAQWGVNTAADATNKLAVKSNAVLFDALDAAEGGTGDARVKVNKEAAGDTASCLFQTGLSGRAEIGLTGDDDFHLKVSADGAAWTDAIFVDKDSGSVGLGTAIPEGLLHIGASTTRYAIIDSIGRIILRFDDNGVSTPFFLVNRGISAAGHAVGIFFGLASGGASLVEAARISVVATGTFALAADQDADLAFYTVLNGAAVTEKMRITSAGDVGIGLTAPAVKLDVDGPVRVKSYTVAGLPSAAAGAGQIIYVSNETGGAVLAFADGTNRRRVTDRAVVA